MREDAQTYVVLFTLPGVRPRDVSATLEGRILTLQAPMQGIYGRRPVEFVFERRVRVPGPIRTDSGLCAGMTNGVLKIVLPKGTEAAATRRVVRIL
jgi:HSP20 family molecular chaperone IbpA